MGSAGTHTFLSVFVFFSSVLLVEGARVPWDRGHMLLRWRRCRFLHHHLYCRQLCCHRRCHHEFHHQQHYHHHHHHHQHLIHHRRYHNSNSGGGSTIPIIFIGHHHRHHHQQQQEHYHHHHHNYYCTQVAEVAMATLTTAIITNSTTIRQIATTDLITFGDRLNVLVLSPLTLYSSRHQP